MLSRDTTVHIATVALAYVLLVLVNSLSGGSDGTAVEVLAYLLLNGLVLGGAHLYLAVRGEDGLVPTAARWRYVAAIAVLLSVGATTLYAGDYVVASVELRTVASALTVLAVVGYFVAEGVAGYRATLSDGRP
ncbi:hypothetical protein [Halorussus pelagicus]|uniref:hypothetical protein n=1 Tax=Halorussus pelagicus TaxID=2505977 RepID=UPI000FFBEA4F|nr:hypothetical protein [Halorussus pelagicus]